MLLRRAPALSAPSRVRAPVVEVAAKLFGTKSVSDMPTRMRELEEYGDVEKKTRDAAPGVELHQLRAREEDADVFARAPARVDAVDRSSSRSSGCVERAAAAAAASASMTSTLTACKK